MKTAEYYDCDKASGKRKITANGQLSSVNRHQKGENPAETSTCLRTCKILFTPPLSFRQARSAIVILTLSVLQRTHQRLALFSCSLLLCACGLNTPEPAPPPGQQAIEITRQQSLSLDRIDTLSVIVRGSPDDADREVQRQAHQRGAQYYRIVSRMESDKLNPGVWRDSAVLYRQPAVQSP